EDDQVLLLATPWPPSGLWGNKPLNSIEALKGVRLRTYDVNGTLTFGNAGATPIQLSWADTVPQLTTNGLDAVLTSADGGAASQLWEHQSHFTEVNYAMPLQFLHMNKDIYDDLSDEQKGWVAAAAKEAEDFGWSLLDNNVAENYARMTDKGMTIVTDLASGYLDALASAAAPSIEDWKKKVGPDADTILTAYQAARAK
ncbi:MAG TPA: TRAP transporter substrate-binding protein DctP, partial [Paenirhodobacter sp.]